MNFLHKRFLVKHFPLMSRRYLPGIALGRRLRYWLEDHIISPLLGACESGHVGYRTLDGGCDECWLGHAASVLEQGSCKLAWRNEGTPRIRW